MDKKLPIDDEILADVLRRVREGNTVLQMESVILDGGYFYKKSFVFCNLIYSGGVPPTLVECDFLNSKFSFDGPARNTLDLLAAFAQGGKSGRDLVFGFLGVK